MSVGWRIPRRDGALAQRLARIRYNAVHVCRYDVSKTFALGTSTEWPIEIEKLRFWFGVVDVAFVASQSPAEREALPRTVVDRDYTPCVLRCRTLNFDEHHHRAVAALEGAFDRVLQTLFRHVARFQSVGD